MSRLRTHCGRWFWRHQWTYGDLLIGYAYAYQRKVCVRCGKIMQERVGATSAKEQLSADCTIKGMR